MSLLKKNVGISLIALIITIIVIIILAAITINGVSGILERSRYAKFCADLDAVQEAVSQAYGTAVLEEAKKPGEKKNSQQIYQELAGGDAILYRDREMYEITNESGLGIKLPTYGSSKWYVDSQTGDVYLLYGFEYNGKVYRSKTDIQGGIEETDYAKFHSVITVDIPAGSIPVIHNGTNWVIADKNSDWYDYRENVRQWANVFTIDADVRNEYLSKPAGTVITDEQVENDVIGMFVYIPRYAYQITSYLHSGGNVAGNIDIVFINQQNQDYEGKEYQEEYPSTTLAEGATGEAAQMNDFVVHPAFTDNAANGGWEHDLDGIWVAKFEASSSTTELVEDKSTDSVIVEGKGKITTNIDTQGRKSNTDENEYITIRPNVTSWRNIDIVDMVNHAKAMAAKHGLTDATSHHIKNSEWGAVAYLTQSIYGNTTLYNNSYYEGEGSYTVVTGMVGSTPDDMIYNGYKKTKKIYHEDGSIVITFTDSSGNALGSKYSPKTYYQYDSAGGYHGSTTGNIYGIYDLAGGAWEYTAGYVTNDNSAKQKQAYTNAWEKNEYAVSTEADNAANNYVANAEKFGDAVFETSEFGEGSGNGWNQDYTYFPCGRAVSFLRGSYFGDGAWTGIFYFDDDGGGALINGFRTVVVQ